MLYKSLNLGAASERSVCCGTAHRACGIVPGISSITEYWAAAMPGNDASRCGTACRVCGDISGFSAATEYAIAAMPIRDVNNTAVLWSIAFLSNYLPGPVGSGFRSHAQGPVSIRERLGRQLCASACAANNPFAPAVCKGERDPWADSTESGPSGRGTNGWSSSCHTDC